MPKCCSVLKYASDISNNSWTLPGEHVVRAVVQGRSTRKKRQVVCVRLVGMYPGYLAPRTAIGALTLTMSLLSVRRSRGLLIVSPFSNKRMGNGYSIKRSGLKNRRRLTDKVPLIPTMSNTNRTVSEGALTLLEHGFVPVACALALWGMSSSQTHHFPIIFLSHFGLETGLAALSSYILV